MSKSQLYSVCYRKLNSNDTATCTFRAEDAKQAKVKFRYMHPYETILSATVNPD